MTFRCADASEARAEPLYGTASFVRRWLFVEQPGGWGSDALMQSALPIDVATELRARARSAGIRIVLIRKGRRFSGEARRCYLATTTARRTHLVRFSVGSNDELLGIDLDGYRDGRSPHEAVDQREPLVLVCTHGRHDACCSIRGNQVSRSVCAIPDLDTWECSHIGGDRFAANVVCFPQGIYYGRVRSEEVDDLISGHRSGLIDLDHFRGRCAYPFPVQAAEYFVRRELHLVQIEDVGFVNRKVESGGVIVTFDTPAGRSIVEVTTRLDEEPRLLTCGAAAPTIIPRYELKSVTPPSA